MTTTRMRWGITAALAAGAVVLAGCTGDGAATSGTTNTAGAAPAGASVDMGPLCANLDVGAVGAALGTTVTKTDGGLAGCAFTSADGSVTATVKKVGPDQSVDSAMSALGAGAAQARPVDGVPESSTAATDLAGLASAQAAARVGDGVLTVLLVGSLANADGAGNLLRIAVGA